MLRRKFLKITGLGAAVFSLPIIGYTGTSINNAAVGLIMNHFHYLNFDKREAEKYTEDYFLHSMQGTRFRIKIKYYYLSKRNPEESSETKSFLSRFLLSTDFFKNKMNEKKAIKYVGLYDPYKVPCSNPFSFLYYSPKPVV